MAIRLSDVMGSAPAAQKVRISDVMPPRDNGFSLGDAARDAFHTASGHLTDNSTSDSLALSQINAALPETLNVAGFDTGIPLSDSISKGLVMLGQGANQVLTGAKQRIADISGNKAESRKLAEEEALNRAQYSPMRQAYPVASTILGGVGQAGMTAPLMFVPGAGAGSALVRALSAATQGGAVGYLTPITKDESVLGNTVLGTGVGAASSALLSGLSKVFNAVKGNFTSPEAQSIYNAASSMDIPLTAGEISGNPILRKTEVLLENVPLVGTSGFRTKQAAATATAASNALESMRPSGVEDVGDAIQQGLQRVLGANKSQARNLYNAVEQASMGAKVTPVPTDQTRAVATQLLKEYPDLFERLPAGTVKSKLDAIIGATAPKASSILDANGAPIIEPMRMNFDEARFLRKQLGNYIDRAAKSAGAVGSDEFRKLNSLKGALETDIEKWSAAPENAAVKVAFDKANSFYRNSVVPFKDALINKATGKDFDTDRIFATFIRPGREKLAGKLMDRLDIEGQQAVKFGVLKSAFDKAIDEKTGIFSPLRFASGVESLSKANKAIFSPQEQKQLTGLVKVMAAAQRAGQYMENPPTGNRVAQLLLGVGGIAGGATGMVSWPALAGGVAMAKALTALTTTDAGKRLLLAASRLPNETGAVDSFFTRSIVPAVFSSLNRNQPRGAASASLEKKQAQKMRRQ